MESKEGQNKINALRQEIYIWLIAGIPLVFIIIFGDKLPEQLPTHWNLKGEIDDYGSKYVHAFISLGVQLLLYIVPKIDPRKKNYKVFASTYTKLRFALAFLLSSISLLVIINALGVPMDMGKSIISLVLTLFVILGNYLSTIKPNWFIGIRTPWTLENEKVWRKTHFLASRIWFWGGLVLFLIILFSPIKTSLVSPIVFIGIILMTVIPVVYSYMIYKKYQTNGKHQ